MSLIVCFYIQSSDPSELTPGAILLSQPLVQLAPVKVQQQYSIVPGQTNVYLAFRYQKLAARQRCVAADTSTAIAWARPEVVGHCCAAKSYFFELFFKAQADEDTSDGQDTNEAEQHQK